jgi:hypothetical protein
MKQHVARFLASAAIVGLMTMSGTVAWAQEKTATQCRDEWRANKADNQAKGITEKAYVAQCRAGGVTAQTAPAPAPAAQRTPAAAQEKTATQCRDEWRASKADNQAKGITEKAYVAQCRAGGVAAQTAPAPSAQRTPAAAQEKTATQCRDEWRANKADNQAKGITEKAYVAQCRAGGGTAQTAPSPSPAPPAAGPKTTAAPAPSPARTTAAAPTGANQFANEADAKARCPSDTVVWVNESSKIYHFAGHKNYGHTKVGAYMCERDATAGGNRAAKDEKRGS